MNKVHLAIIASVVALDRISKHLIERHIPLDESLDVIPGFFRLTHLQNPGGAFSMFAGSSAPWRTPALILFAVAVLVVIFIVLWRNREMNATTIALSLIFGGALGNLWDRLAHGAVTDFLDFYVGTYHWYPFNIADSAIVAGGLLVLAKMLLTSEKKAANRSR